MNSNLGEKATLSFWFNTHQELERFAGLGSKKKKKDPSGSILLAGREQEMIPGKEDLLSPNCGFI